MEEPETLNSMRRLKKLRGDDEVHMDTSTLGSDSFLSYIELVYLGYYHLLFLFFMTTIIIVLTR